MDWKDTDIAARYKSAEAMMGPFALRLIKQCGLDRADGSADIVALNNARGTGVVTAGLYEHVPAVAQARMSVLSGDFAPGMVEEVQQRIKACGWTNAEAKVLDATKLDLPDDRFTHVFASFAILLMSDPPAALAEAFRVLQPGGVLGATFPQNAAWYVPTATAVARIPPEAGAPALPPFGTLTSSFDKTLSAEQRTAGVWVDPEYITARYREAGFVDVQVELHPMEMRCASAEEYVQKYAGMTRAMMRNMWGEEELAAVDPHFNAVLLEAMKEMFGEGECVLPWGAYCVMGKKP